MKSPLIEFQKVTKHFNGQAVLEEVDLEIYEGQVTTIIGKSGSGKSVLLKHIIGLLTPDEGTILFQGQPVEKMTQSERNRHFSQISYMFQNNALFDSMTVFDNIALPLRETTDLNEKAISEKVKHRMKQTVVSHQFIADGFNIARCQFRRRLATTRRSLVRTTGRVGFLAHGDLLLLVSPMSVSP